MTFDETAPYLRDVFECAGDMVKDWRGRPEGGMNESQSKFLEGT
jgi:hypothetical protein